ncbi:MAG TPA: amino acid adenylation domain-containing protein, partial [Gemmatimonadaceae bacterium]|nr:amino acid adenylation domain-containing protein [Gemmatimonadaceae bacterium]
RHRLLWSMHHAIMDGWSALIVLEETMRDYDTLASGGTPNVTAALSFDSFVGWVQAQDRGRDEAFWRRTLAGFPGPASLPGGRTSRRAGSTRVKTTHLLSLDATRELRSTAARLRVTVNTLLVGAWTIMLARHAGRDDVIVGVTVSERPAELPGVERAAGLYLSTVPVRAPVQQGIAADDWLRRLQLALSEARSHAAPGLAAIQRWSDQPPATPLFESLVVFENFSDDAMSAFIPGDTPDDEPVGDRLVLRAAAMDVPNDIPLVLLALPGDRLSLQVVSDPEVVPEWIAARLASQLVTLLVALAGDPRRPVTDLTAIDAAERAMLLDEWSGARAVPPEAIDVVDRFEQRAAATPNAIALWTEYAHITYEALDRHANRLATRLATAGLGDNPIVGILADQPADAVTAMVAALKAGAAYVPLDSRLPNARLRRMVAPLHAVIAAPWRASHIDDVVRTLRLDDAADVPDQRPPRPATADHAAYVIFTSGSTGEPKGVVVERGQLAASTAARDVHYPEPPSRFLLLSPTSVDSAVAGIYWTLSTGGTLVLPPARAEQDADALGRLVERAGVTHTLLVPSLYRALLDTADPRRLASFRCVIVAGEECPQDVVQLHHARLPEVALHNEYGPTEATVWAAAALLAATDAGVGRGRTPIGRPVPGVRVYLLDDALRPVPAGSVGEICIGGVGVARGYLGLPDETARRFVADPFAAGGRIYRSGDRGRFREDGQLEFLGRADEQIKVRGFRIEPGEIERALVEHPAVRDGAVALVRPPVPDDPAALVAALTNLADDEVERMLRDAEAVT